MTATDTYRNLLWASIQRASSVIIHLILTYTHKNPNEVSNVNIPILQVQKVRYRRLNGRAGQRTQTVPFTLPISYLP